MTPSFKINISSAPLEQRDPDLSTAFNDREIAVAENIRHLCVPLGPYRNLTTITAAIFATHKRALVLNHAAIRVLSDESLDVFKNPAEDTFLHFKRVAVRLSRGGQRGDYGGDIRLSHAFESDELVNLYLRYHKSGVLNENATALFWKDSMRILNHMTANGLRPGDLARDHRFFRFLVPIRSPLDCAKSNIRSGHFMHLSRALSPTVNYILDKILFVLRYLHDEAKRCSERFFFFTENEWNSSLLKELCWFCTMECDENWAMDVVNTVRLRPRYMHQPDEIEFYRSRVRECFADAPQMAERLLLLS